MAYVSSFPKVFRHDIALMYVQDATFQCGLDGEALFSSMRELRKDWRTDLTRKDHNFQEKTFTQPTECDHCGTLLLGHSKQVTLKHLLQPNFIHPFHPGMAMLIFKLHG